MNTLAIEPDAVDVEPLDAAPSDEAIEALAWLLVDASEETEETQ